MMAVQHHAGMQVGCWMCWMSRQKRENASRCITQASLHAEVAAAAEKTGVIFPDPAHASGFFEALQRLEP